MIDFIKKTLSFMTMIIIIMVFISCSNEKINNNEREDGTEVKNNIFTITNNWGYYAIDYQISDIANICVGVIDSANYYQANNVRNYSVNQLDQVDTIHHGSFIVSTLCSMLPTTEIININVADKVGNITSKSLAKGIEYAVKSNCDIISISLGTQINYTEIETQIKYAIKEGCIIVAAAGNNSDTQVDYPANYDNVISVMSRGIDNIDDRTNNISSTKKSFSAPGSVIFNNNFVISGSSIATVYVTAEVAFILDKIPYANYDMVFDILKKSAIFSTDYSYGMINHNRILEKLNQRER